MTSQPLSKINGISFRKNNKIQIKRYGKNTHIEEPFLTLDFLLGILIMPPNLNPFNGFALPTLGGMMV